MSSLWAQLDEPLVQEVAIDRNHQLVVPFKIGILKAKHIDTSGVFAHNSLGVRVGTEQIFRCTSYCLGP